MHRDLLDPAEIPGMIRACLRLHFRPPPRRAVRTLAIKFRSESLFRAEQFHAAFPEARYVFLYRDDVGWARSPWYFGQNPGIPLVLAGEDLRFDWWVPSAAGPMELLAPYLDPDGSIPIERELAVSWALRLEEYLRLRALGVPFVAIRYDELQADPQASATRMFRHCGLPVEASAAAVGALDHDSQAGTVIARDRRDGAPFTEAGRPSSARRWRGSRGSSRLTCSFRTSTVAASAAESESAMPPSAGASDALAHGRHGEAK